ncbi:MAG TPA: flagellar FliJ family protein [Candidatus Sulfotelmatobacter sp.]|jgi:flagellar biosynthesis chaperone FliJ|nr:flagellar FliJ family protein [Candidatus Sulfotelmatobacter sp.]
MAAPFVYRLQLLLEQKEEAKKAAEQELARREQELERQQGILAELKRREQELIDRRATARRELLSAPDNHPLAVHVVQARSDHIRALGEDIEAAGKEVARQQDVIRKCQQQVEDGKQKVNESRREVEVLAKHRKKQEERFLREAAAKEELELDEIGNVLYMTRQRSS